MDIRKIGKDISFLKNNTQFIKIINTLLAISVIVGLILKYFYSQGWVLHSDSVYSGLASNEIWTNKNFFLVNYYSTQVDPFYFTDIYPFQLIPQIVMNFSPFALKFANFCVFCLIILLFGYLVYKISGNLTNSLIFAALISNLTPGSYGQFANIFHVGTVALIGLLLILLFRFPDLRWYEYLISLILLLLIVFSDQLVLIWFVVPGLVYYVYVYVYPAYFPKKKKSDPRKNSLNTNKIRGLWFVCLSIFATILVIIYSKYFIPYLLPVYTPLQIVDFSMFLNNAIYFIQSIFLLYNYVIYQLLTATKNLGILDYLTIIASLALVVYSIYFSRDTIHKKMVIFFIFSLLSCFVILSFTNLPGRVRYLLIFGILIYVVIALSYRKSDRIFLALVFCVLLCNGATAVGTHLQVMNATPNSEEYQIIDYLKANNLNHGFGDYWDSNLLTYISNGNVTIRGVVVNGNSIAPFRWLSAESWYDKNELSKFNFILVKNISPMDRPFVNRDNIKSFLAAKPPVKVLHYMNYDIYSY